MATETDLRSAESVVDLFRGAARSLLTAACREHSIVRLPDHGRLLATGDLHDNPEHLRKIIAAARLGASPDHHVTLHELIHGENLINGMDFSHRTLARVATLVLAHPGQVHPLLANHELAQMIGRGVSKGAGNSVELFNEAVEYVFGDDAPDVVTAINAFVAAMPLALVSASGVLCAHSLPGPLMMKHFDPQVLRRDLVAEDYQPPHGAAYLMVWGRQYTQEQIATLAAEWDVRLFCLGHEHAETGIEMRGPRTIILNSDHEAARVLPIDLAHVPTAEEALMSAVPLAAIG